MMDFSAQLECLRPHSRGPNIQRRKLNGNTSRASQPPVRTKLQETFGFPQPSVRKCNGLSVCDSLTSITALELAEDYQIKPWIQALLDPEPIDKGASDLTKSISPPPKFTFTVNDHNSILPPPTPRGRGRPRSRSPSKVTTPSKKLTASRKSRSMKAANAATAREASASLQAALDSAASIGDSESVDGDRVRVEVDSAVDVNGDIEVTTTSVKVEMPAGSPEMPLPESTEEMIAKAKEMVEEARKLEGGEPSKTRGAKRKIDVLDDSEDTEADEELVPAKGARMLARKLKKERVQKRALTGIVATLVIG